jgi:formate dehydrogenase gamma subunit
MGTSRCRWVRWSAISVVLAATTITGTATVIKNSECLECHSDRTLATTNAAQKEVSLFVDEARFMKSAHRTNSCASCHDDLTSKHPDDNRPAMPVNCAKCHPRQSESYGGSVHGLAFKAGKPGAAGCVDCHDTHEVLPPASPESPLHLSKLTATCGQCHEEAAREVASSVHGKAVTQGNRDAATCTGCHSEHKIEKLRGVSSLKIAGQVCGKCHASERLNTKYNLPNDRVKTFFESYHGLAAQYGSTVSANCASCHGIHKILASSDPDSTIHKANLAKTCGQCHPGASDKFAQSTVHIDVARARAGDVGGQINVWVRKIYLWMIVAVIGLMALHNGLIFLKKARLIRRSQTRSVLRMNVAQRVQHAVLLISFVVLALTGFALKFPESWLAHGMGSNEAFRSWAHRIAGVVLLGIGAYHTVYVLATRQGRQLIRDFLPRAKDLSDVAANACYLTGVKSAKPKFGRFGYAEKAEYWALVWGTIIMGVTGLMIWFKMDVTKILPRWALDVATTIHYYEAILACLAIVVWHFYHVIFDPDVYPLNWACVDGHVSEHWQQEEHPLDVPERDAPKRGRESAPITSSRNGEMTARFDYSI